MKSKIIKINSLLFRYFGSPKRNSKLPDPLDLLIATILSQNTNDQNSYKAYNNLRKRFPSWEQVQNARRTSIEKEIRVAGLGYQKSKAIKTLLTKLKESREKISLDYLVKENDESIIRDLTSYNGIGVKTASCVLLFSLDRNVCPVDTHVHRTLNRIGLVKTASPEKTFFKINENFPPKIAHSFHTNLIKLGREICKPKNPFCSGCPLRNICVYKLKDFENSKKSPKREFMLLDNIP